MDRGNRRGWTALVTFSLRGGVRPRVLGAEVALRIAGAAVLINNDRVQPERTRRARWGSALVVIVAVIAVTAILHLLLLGWHDLQQYETWKVVSYAVLTTALVAAAAWVRPGLFALIAAAATLAVTLLWSVDAATSTGDVGASLWPISAVMILVGAGAGSLLTALAASYARTALFRHASHPA